MSTDRLRLTILALAVIVLASPPATAGIVMSANSFLCGGTGPENAKVTVSEKNSLLTLRFTGRDLTPSEAVTCGYRCSELGNDASGPCGVVDQHGRWSGKIVLPQVFCWGLVPFFNTGSHGSCLPATFP
jgi:hypothetical protein